MFSMVFVPTPAMTIESTCFVSISIKGFKPKPILTITLSVISNSFIKVQTPFLAAKSLISISESGNPSYNNL
jgi:hypothetical protein